MNRFIEDTAAEELEDTIAVAIGRYFNQAEDECALTAQERDAADTIEDRLADSPTLQRELLRLGIEMVVRANRRAW